MRHFLFFILFFGINNSTFAQNFRFVYNQTNAIKTANNQPLPNAWAGGTWSPQFNECDLNADGIEDLVVFDRADYSITTYLKQITGGNAQYVLAPEYAARFPKLLDYMLMVDYNFDGKKDIFTSGNIAPRVYKNTTTTPGVPDFTLEKAALYTKTSPLAPLTNIYIVGGDVPAIVDVDADGDLDILAFENNGSSVALNLNKSKELYGHADSLVFALTDRCWGRFSENLTTNQITLGLSPSCTSLRPKNPNQTEDPLHSGSTVSAFDPNHDGKIDLLLGDISFNNLVMIQNQSPPGDVAVAVDNSFPSYNTPVNLPIFPYASFVDFNNDNKKDMLVSVADIQFALRSDQVLAYKNIGNAQKDSFDLVANDFLVKDMIDNGYTSAPTFLDVNNDGIKDLILSTHNAARKAVLRLYLATATTPVGYTAADTNYLNLSSYGITNAILATGDLNADAKPDLLVGTGAGKVMYFSNVSPPNQPASFTLITNNFEGINVNYNAAPELFDYNQDGKIDLFLGKRNGNIDYYPNTGTAAAPIFGNQPATTNFGKIDVKEPSYFSGFAVPRFADLNQNGNTDMVVGSQGSQLYFYPDVMGKMPTDSFLVSENNFYLSINSATYDVGFGRFSTPAIADLNADVYPDLVVGTHRGGLVALWNNSPSVGTAQPNPTPKFKIEITPNPVTSNNFRLLLHNYSPQTGDVAMLYNAQGQEIAQKRLAAQDQNIALDWALPKGFYTLKVCGKNILATTKLIVQ